MNAGSRALPPDRVHAPASRNAIGKFLAPCSKKDRFARDSPLEGNGFEVSGPRRERNESRSRTGTVTEATKDEARQLAEIGVDVIQFDEPAFNVYMKELEPSSRMGASECGLKTVDGTLASQRSRDGRCFRTIPIGADAHRDLSGKIDSLDVFEKTMHEVLTRLLTVGDDIDPGVFLLLQQGSARYRAL